MTLKPDDLLADSDNTMNFSSMAAGQNAQTTALKLNQLEKTVRSGGQQLAILQGVNIEIKSGQSVAIVGASGSGKSTLLGIMAGLDNPSAGEIELLGQPLHGLNEDQRAAVRAQGVAFVFQNFQLLPGLTALENVMLAVEIQGSGVRGTAKKSAADARQRAQTLLAQVGLGERGHHYPAQLSGGEQQRVAIARAFAGEPKVLFADEPTGNLDRETGGQIEQLLFDLNREQGTTLILVTHDVRLAERCQRRFEMRAGQLDEMLNEGLSL